MTVGRIETTPRPRLRQTRARLAGGQRQGRRFRSGVDPAERRARRRDISPALVQHALISEKHSDFSRTSIHGREMEDVEQTDTAVV